MLFAIISALCAGYYQAFNPTPACADEAPHSRFVELASRAAMDLRRPTDEQIRHTLERIRQAMPPVDRRLATFGRQQAGWRAYLEWDELVAQMKADPWPDPLRLERTGRRYAAAAELFTDPNFALQAQLLRRAAELIRCATMTDEEFNSTLNRLTAALQENSSAPTQSALDEVAEAMGWLEQRGQAAELISTVREDFHRPNLFVNASKRLLAIDFDERVETSEAFNDRILGTNYSGTNWTSSRVAMRLVPNTDRIALEFLLGAIVRSRSTGYNGPAVVQSTGRTTIRGQKAVTLDEHGFLALPAGVQANNRSEILDFSWNRVLGRRAAMERAYQDKRQTERIVAQRATARASGELDRRIQQSIEPFDLSYARKIRLPLIQRGHFPTLVRCSSTDDWAHVVLTQANAFQLAAHDEPPVIDGTPDLGIRAHDSWFNNLASGLLAGRTVREPQLESDWKELFGTVPSGLRTADAQRPWSVTFSASKPIQLDFGDGRMAIHLRADGFTVGDQAYPGMWITATYVLASGDDRSFARRDGPLMIVPPEFSNEEGQRLGVRQQVLRSLIRNRFQAIFPETIEPQPLSLPEPWRRGGKLHLASSHAQHGWLVASWSLTGRE
jgi:hypothetical protein